MDETFLLRRSLVSVTPIPGGVRIVCDCATVTDLIIEGEIPETIATQEDALICDGCGTSHWYTISGSGPTPAA